MSPTTSTFSFSEFADQLTRLGLQVNSVRSNVGWFSVVNRQQIAMFHVVSQTFVSGWCLTPRGRIDLTSAEQLLGAIRAVIE